MILLPHECRRTPESWAAACHEDRGLLPLFACWLQDECDDPRRAAAVRWLAREGKSPEAWGRPRQFKSVWRREDGMWTPGLVPACTLLPEPLYDALGGVRHKSPHYPARLYPTPEAAVLDLLRVWTPELVGERA